MPTIAREKHACCSLVKLEERFSKALADDTPQTLNSVNNKRFLNGNRIPYLLGDVGRMYGVKGANRLPLLRFFLVGPPYPSLITKMFFMTPIRMQGVCTLLKPAIKIFFIVKKTATVRQYRC
jgi:hypothetical protein